MLNQISDEFAQSCGIREISKTVFPYERFRSISEIIKTEIFPHYADFKSSLSKPLGNNYLAEFSSEVENKLKQGIFRGLR